MWERLFTKRKPPEPAPAPEAESSRPMIQWAGEAYIQATVVKVMTERHGFDEQFAMDMRPVLLEHAQKLVAILRGEAPVVSGSNVLKFETRKP